MTTLDQLKDRLPDYARDLKINLGVVTGTSTLTPRQHWGTAVAAALAARQPDVIAAVTAAAGAHLDEAALRAARGAASVMAMNNVYYRFLHFVGEGNDYQALPARLRMQLIGNPGVDALDFELWCLAASAVTGCGACVVSHDQVVRSKGAQAPQVQDAIRIAAVVHALAATLDGVAATATALTPS
ncbi:MAG: carboxymuconolactone decarboxylase family protein [Myxococcales bacterium]|nr:carboxymuconolactone decarboxylase family protein [Myxococcales bacterium]